MERKRELTDQRHNWAFLVFLCAAAFFVVGRRTSLGLFRGAYPFLETIAQPGMILLLGWKSREWFSSRKETVCGGVGLIVLGYLQKVLVYWAQVALDQNPVFYPFNTSGVAWVFLAGGAYVLSAPLWDRPERSDRSLLLGAVALGLAGGLCKFLDSSLCLAQICTFAPFFVLGRRMTDGQLGRWTGRGSLRAAALFLLAGGTGACLVLRNLLKPFWPMLDGDSWYGACEPIEQGLLPLVGIALRLIWYLGAAALLWALFCICPNRRLPGLTVGGERALGGCFWFRSLAYLTLAPVLASATGPHIVLSGVATAVLLLAGLSWQGWQLVEAVIRTPWRLLQDKEEPPVRPIGYPTFYERHRWGVDMTLLFTLAFAVAAVAYVYPFDSNGKALVWQTDGLSQQYPMMFYFKEYVLGVIQALLTGEGSALPQWDFALGMGMSPLDVVRREPFMLLSLLGNEETMELIASITVLLRRYVCGLVFLWLCYTLGKREKLPALMGAFAYLFSGFFIFASARQPYFVTVLMTYLPLTLIGAERYIRQRKRGVFVLAVFLQIFNGYYTAYINGVILAVYLLVRLGCKNGRDIRATVAEILRLIGLYLWGLGMGMCTFLPGVLSLFGSSRSAVRQTLNLFYNKSYYEGIFSGLNLEFGGTGYWTYISMAAIAWLAVLLLFLRRDPARERERQPLRVAVITAAVLLSFPIFGQIFNGFAYVSNRWSFAVCLAVALVLVEMAPAMLDLTAREKGVLLCAVLIYSGVNLTRSEVSDRLRLMGVAVLCMTLLVVLMMDQYLRSRRLRMSILATVTVLTVMFNTAASFLPELGEYVQEFMDEGTVYEAMAGDVEEALALLPDQSEEFYRLAQDSTSGNQSMGLDFYGLMSYYSVTPTGSSDYAAELCMPTQNQVFRIYSFDKRTVPNALASVRYYLIDDEGRVPYGYTKVAELDGGESGLYENEYALPLGYTYTSYISAETYNSLTSLEKQQVMLEGAVLEEDTDLLTQAEPTWQEEQIPCQISQATDVTVDDGAGTITVDEADGSIQISFAGMENCETYLVLQGIEYQSERSEGSSMITCDGELGTTTAAIRGQNQSYYFQRDGIIFNLGYQEEAQSTCTLTFSKAVDLEYEAIYVVCIPMDSYADQVSQLSEVTLENVTETGDRITGTIELEDARLLALSIPYAEGWKAYVNGQEVEVLRVNTMYCGLLLEPGSYEIELRYEHPGLKAGAAISLLSVAAIVPVWAIGRRRRKQASNPGDSV